MSRRLLIAVCAATLLAASLTPRAARAWFWEPTHGPDGGLVRSLAVLSPDTVVAGMYFGGIYRTTDGGATWTASSSGLGDPHVFALIVAPGGALYAGTFGGGVFRSVDRGLHWQAANDGLWRLQVQSLAALSADTLLAGTYQGAVFRSTDAGASWTWSGSGLPSAAAQDVHAFGVLADGRVLIGTYDHVYRSSDRGASWVSASTGLTNLYCWAMKVRADGLVVTGTPNGCYLSSDGGDHWSFGGMPVNNAVLDVDARANGELFAATGIGVWTSADGGLSWTQHRTGLTTTDTECVRVAAGTRVYAGSSGGGAFRSDDDGTTWSAASGSLRQTHVAALLATPSGALVAGTERAGVYRSLDHGDSWSLTTLTDRSITALALSGSDVIAAYVGGVARSHDGGATWTDAGSGLVDVNAWALTARPAGDVFVGTSIGVERLASFGGTWQVLAGFPASTGIGALLTLADGTVLAGTLNNGAQRSPDDGATWVAVNTGLPANTRVLALAADTAGRVFAGTMNGGVFRTLDHGDHWTPVAAAGRYVSALTVNAEDHVFAAVRFGGVFRSLDHGATWDSLTFGLGASDVLSLATDARDVVFGGTNYEGVYRSMRPTSAVEGPVAATLTPLSAGPNPSRGGVTLRFALARAARARLVIYDVAGRPVRRVLDGALPAGVASRAWDGRDESGRPAPAGLYFARLDADGRVATARMVRVE